MSITFRENFYIGYSERSSGISVLSAEQKQKNRQTIVDILSRETGASIVSCCGVLGCFNSESTINPGAQNINEKYGYTNKYGKYIQYANTYGAGLAQWTLGRHTKLEQFMRSLGYNNWYDSGLGQMRFFLEEINPSSNYSIGSWYSSYSKTTQILGNYQFRNPLDALKCDTWTVYQATVYWFSWYENGGGTFADSQLSARYNSAVASYEALTGYNPKDPPIFNFISKRKMPIYMYLRNPYLY